MNNPTIIIVAYNRPDPLKRLLSSLKEAKYPDDVKIVISIDKGDNYDVLNIAEGLNWPFGEKKVISQEKHLGLRNHILKCGDLTQKFESVIILEDDLIVSPMFYKYATKALNFYKDDKNIAGISLYSISQNFLVQLPFLPFPDESDIFFLQIPESWGQAWNREQWMNFRVWFNNNDSKISSKDNLPQSVISWPESSWTKYFWKFMVKTNRYFVFPRESFTTNFGYKGTHVKKKNPIYQVPLQLFKNEFRFKDFNNSIAVYDPFFEILPNRLNRLTDLFKAYNYEVDLYGNKQLDKIKADYLLTSKNCRESILSFGKEMKPIEINIIEKIRGKDLYFCKKDVVKENKYSKHFRWYKDFIFFHRNLSIKNLIFLLTLKIFRRI